jgi:hypothetical protein
MLHFFRVRGIPPPIASMSLHADAFFFIALCNPKSHSLEVLYSSLMGSCRFDGNLGI